MRQNEWNETIQDALKQTAEQIRIDDLKKEQIRYAVLRTGKEEKRMKKHKNWKKVVCAVGIMCMLSVGAVVAGGRITGYMSSSSHMNDVTEYAKMPQEIQKLGYPVEIPEAFSNGYQFESGQVVSVKAMDETGNTVGTYPELTVYYQKAGDAYLILSVEKPLSNETSLSGEEMDCDGVPAYYSEEHYRFVPPSYQVSEEEQKLIDSGDLYVSYGTDSVQDTIVKNISWKENDVRYMIMVTEKTDMGAEEFLQMAKEIRMEQTK